MDYKRLQKGLKRKKTCKTLDNRKWITRLLRQTDME